jgi:hypothetical protein
MNTPIIFGLSLEVYIINLIIGIPVFFILRWIFRKWIKNARTLKLVTWIGTLVCTPVTYIGLIVLWISITSYYPNSDFDKVKWNIAKEKRYEMSGDIIKSQMLIGKTKLEVLDILGYEGNKMESDTWYYDLGFVPRFMAIDPDVLTIIFANGKAIKVSQHET